MRKLFYSQRLIPRICRCRYSYYLPFTLLLPLPQHVRRCVPSRSRVQLGPVSAHICVLTHMTRKGIS